MTLSEACIKIEEQESMWDYSIDRSLFLSPTVYIPLPYYATTSSGSTGESGNSSHSVCPMESSLYSDILSLNYDNNIDHVYYMSDSDDTSPTSTHMYSASSIYHHRLLQDNQPIRYIQPEDMTLQWPSTRLDEDTKHNNRLEGVRNELDSLKLSQEDDREDGREDGSDYTVYIADTNKKRGYRTDNEDYREKVTETTRKRRYTNKRTVTSYDAETTLYLKSVFFEVYSKQNKLTKQQRAEVQERTGLPSRNITYWFSNHKRRFQKTLAVYKELVNKSNGSIKTYADFIQWKQYHNKNGMK